jgi:general secretion pathway protein I
MVALAVVAIALPALMVSLYQQVDGTAYLRDKSLAQMVAANKLAEIRILTEASRLLPEGSASGVETLAEREWHWWRETKKTELPDFFRIEIKVAQSEEQVDEPLITLAAFMSSDLTLEQQAEVGDE